MPALIRRDAAFLAERKVLLDNLISLLIWAGVSSKAGIARILVCNSGTKVELASGESAYSRTL